MDELANSDKLWDLIYPVLIDKYKRVEGEIDGWQVTAYRVITTVRIDLKPMLRKGSEL